MVYAINGLTNFTVHCSYSNLTFDEEAPVINPINNIDSAEWKKNQEFVISGTENYCSSVNVDILDGENVVYTGTASVTNNNWSITAKPELEAGVEGRTFIVRVTDPCQNSSTQEVTIGKIDGVMPEPKVSEIVIGGDWAKEKNYTFGATDDGIGAVSIAFNDLSEYKLAGIDEDGTFERKYRFIGDVYEPREAVVYYKDYLGNTTAQTITIDKLDNTAPTIVEASISENVVTVNAHDRHETEGDGSGIVKYRYIMSRDRLNNPLITESNSVTIDAAESFTIENLSPNKYVYLVAIDKVGNVSDVYIIEANYELNLETDVNLDAANGHGGVDLSWNGENIADAVFKAYQKKEGSNEWESISTVDLYNKNEEQIKVLNVYPTRACEDGIVPPIVTFTYADGTTASLPKSASLKVWMEGGTMNENGILTTFEAYGKNPITGEQLLDITLASSDEFNEDPEMLWNYDVVMFGIWDTNGNSDDQPNANAIDVLERYIRAGYGILAGHDSIGWIYYDSGLNKLRKYFNIEVGYIIDKYHGYTKPSDMSVVDYDAGWAYMSTKVKVEENGLLTNFPYELAVGTVLTVPSTHSNSNAAKGKTWMNLINGIDNLYNYGSIQDYYNARGTGNPVYYLTTYNNTAMIQTGHSNCDSTADERKVLANTLFYLKQRTTAKSFTDNSAQDLKAPNTPEIQVARNIGNNNINVAFNSEDNGSTYSYYVQAYDENDASILLATSNERTETVTTGIRGYYYVIDDNPENHDFDIYNATFTTEKSLDLDISNNSKYIHMKAIDNAGRNYTDDNGKYNIVGNVSEPTVVKIEEKSTATIKLNGGTLNGATADKTRQEPAGSTIDLGAPTRDGYTFKGWECSKGTISGNNYTFSLEDDVINAIWEINKYDYSIEYYFNGMKDEPLTENGSANFGSIIDTYTNKIKNGYKFEKTENLPLSVSSNPARNVMKVYYITDASQTKTLEYTVEYYKGTEKVLNDTQVVNQTVQYLQPSTLTVVKSQINTVNKYSGYKLKEIRINNNKVNELPASVNNGDIIQIYYDIDENQTKTLSYTVEYYLTGVKQDKDTQTETQTVQLLADDIITVDKSKINTTNKYRGYRLSRTSPNPIPDSVYDGDVIRVYYVIDDEQTKELSYTVQYFKDGVRVGEDTQIEKATVQLLDPDELTVKKGNINIVDKYYGYKFDEERTGTIPTITPDGSTINIYYVTDESLTKELRYTVEYYKDGVKADEDTQTVRKTVQILAEDELAVDRNDIDTANKYEGYKLDKLEKNNDAISIIPSRVENGAVLKVYYVTDNDQTKTIKYTVEYYRDNTKVDEDVVTNKVQVLQPNALTVDKSAINTTDKYDGYKLDDLRVNDRIVADIPDSVNHNDIIKVYFTKRTDLSYTVNYLDAKTKEAIPGHPAQTIGKQEFGSVITEKDVFIDIDGYEYDYTLPSRMTIQANVSENVVNVYYTKMTGLSYTINYLDKDTGESIWAAGKKGEQEFGTVIRAENEIISVPGYNYDHASAESITIGTVNTENVLNIYYAKKTDLTYEINYLEKGTDKVLETKKVKGGKTLYDVVNSVDEKITINGYYYDSCEKESIVIEPENNVIKLYYTKRNDLVYTVNYLEKGSGKVLQDSKVIDTAVFEAVINSSEEVASIDGYNYDSCDKNSITIGTDSSKNVINLYYTKKNDLVYTINYLEKDTNKVLSTAKVVSTATFEDVVNADSEVISINGYNYYSADKASITIGTDASKNVINLYYTKKNDLAYTVNYLEKDSDKVLHTAKVVNTATFEQVILSEDEVISIDGYNYNSCDKDRMTITTGVNIINLYYTKKSDLTYTVNYLEKGTYKELEDAKVVNTATFEEVINSVDEIISINGYNYDSADKESITITTGVNVINLYYTKRTDLKYKVNYIEESNNKEIEPSLTVENQIFEVEIDASTVIKAIDGFNYRGCAPDKIKISTDENRNVINLYYARRNDLSYTVNYLELDTNKSLRDAKTVGNKIFGDTINAADEKVDITGYKFDSYSIDKLTIGTGANVINIYYTVDDEQTKELSYTVEYYKDGIKQEDDTQVEKATVQVLQPDVVRVDKSKINTLNKYVAYKLDTRATGEIPDSIANGGIIKVYFIRNNERTGYVIDYYYDNMRDPARREVVEANVGETITRASITDKIANNMKDGYKLLTVGNVPLVTGYDLNKDIIKVFYTSALDKTGYTIEYYYDGVRDNSLTEAGEAKVGDIIAKENIMFRINANLKDGYKYLSIANNPLTIVEDSEQNVIKVYYMSETKDGLSNNDSGYTLEYYYNYVRDNIRSEVVETEPNIVITKDDIQSKIDANKKAGYKVLTVANVPITTGKPAENNIIKIYYIDENSSKVGYKLEYYYDFVKDARKTEVVEASVGDVINNNMIAEKVVKNAGADYRLLRVVNTPLTITVDVEDNVIKVYYVNKATPENEVGYTLEYYYDYKKENARSEMVKATVGDVITKETIADRITANTKAGYKFLTAANLPMTIEYDVDNNVIKVYYIKKMNDDGTLNKKLGYSIEYYYDEVRKSDLTEVIEADKGDIITKAMVQGKANANAKAKEGYKLSQIVNVPLTITEDVDDNVIKVFYIKEKTTGPSGEEIPNNNSGYSIEYYYDGIKKNRVTDGIESPKGEVITREAIENRITKNRLPGYRVLTVLNVPLTVENNPESNVIKVYYVSSSKPETNVGYSIEYYYDYIKDNTRTELFEANVGDIITRDMISSRITANTKDGYKLLTVTNAPITIVKDIDRNVIKVYYIRTTTPAEKVGYTIEYYYDEVRDNRLTETVETTAGEVITNADIDSKVKANTKSGYKLLKIANTPMTITKDTDNNVIKVYYVDENSSDTGYTIEYYYEYVKDNKKTEVIGANLGDVITQEMVNGKIANNTKSGYKYLIALNLPLTIDVDLDENVIKVYYIAEKTPAGNPNTKIGYTIEYYYDGVRKNSLSEEISAAKGDVVTRDMIDNRVDANMRSGYRLLNVVNVPLTVTEDVPENIIKVYYISDTKPAEDIGYSIEYYYNGIKRNSLTEMVEANIGEVITDSDIADKIEAHKPANLIRVVALGTPLTIRQNVDENVIRVYYVLTPTTDAEHVKYQIKYHYDGIINPSKTSTVDDIRGNVIDNSIIDRYVQNNMTTGYRLDRIENTPIVLGTDINENVVEVYYVKRTDLSYRVEYLEQGTDISLAEDKVVNNQTFGEIVREDAINIDGYDKVNPISKTISIKVDENVITFHYTKRNDLQYKVNYIERSTGKTITDSKIVTGQVFEAVVEEKAINVEGYNLDDDDSKTIVIGTSENVINFYYTKRNDLAYKINHYEDGTTNVVAPQEIVENVEFETVVDSNARVKTIDGYSFKSCDPESLIVGVDENKNVINIYYRRVDGLTYTVNYVEKGNETNILKPAKITDKQVYGSVIKATDEIVPIDGYNYDSVSTDTIKIETDVSKNVITIYYTRRNDLTYTVNYLEQGSNKVIADAKVVNNQIFEAKVKETAIDIDGYDKPVVTTQSIEIATSGNEINFYYTKRTDLSYKVEYLEKGSNKTLQEEKIVEGKTFGDVIICSDEVIAIDGYNFDSVDNMTITIGTDENVIHIYYTKRNNLSYTVNYIEKDTAEILKTQKVVNNVVFETEVTVDGEKVNIDGYVYDSASPENFKVGTDSSKNVMNIYYTKRGDLSYTVNYLDIDDGKAINEQKIKENQVLGRIINSSDEVINIDGYVFDSFDKTTMTIGTGENVINIYYSKRKDLSYTINFWEKDTNEVLAEPIVVRNQVFGTVVSSNNKNIAIEGYDYHSADKKTITIETNEAENVFNLYYTKNTELSYKVNYIEKETNNVIKEQKIVNGMTYKDEVFAEDEIIEIDKYDFDSYESEKITIGTGENVINLYYIKKPTKVIVHFYEEGTTNKLSENVVIEGRIDDRYEAKAATDVPAKYELSITPDNAKGSMTEEIIEVIYFYRVRDTYLNIRYLEKNTNIELATPERQSGKVEEDYITGAKTIEGYTLVEDSGNITGKLTIAPITVTFYYLQNTSVEVNHIDKNTGEVLDSLTVDGLVGDKYTANAKDIANYVLVERPRVETVTMSKDKITLNYYYVHVSAGVIEKHVDIITGDILYNTTHEGNEGDAYNIVAKTFEGYDLATEKMPANARGTMTISPIEVTYYYKYRSSVTAEYIDTITNRKLASDIVINGYEADSYVTERKEFDGYKLVEVPANSEGKMTKAPIKVTYRYVHESAGVEVKHIDIKTGKELVKAELIPGYEADEYTTKPQNIPGYDLVKDRIPTNAEGKMTIDKIIVEYYYIKQSSVTAKYIDKITGDEIEEEVLIEGHEGDKYETEAKEIEGYDLVEVPENAEGIMGADPSEVIYEYHRPAKVIINYIDVDTNEEIIEPEVIEGHQDDEYETEAKEIKYYNLVEDKLPKNAKGKMTVNVTKDKNKKELVDDETIVNYYYKKMEFSIKVDKIIDRVILNGQTLNINGDIGKIEINKKELPNAKLQIIYKIRVINNGELAGKATLLEKLPNGTTMSKADNQLWEISGATATMTTEEIKPGETKEYTVILDWTNSEGNVGNKENKVDVLKTENEAGFDEGKVDLEDSDADLVISISTGSSTYMLATGVVMIVLAGISVVLVKKTKEENE